MKKNFRTWDTLTKEEAFKLAYLCMDGPKSREGYEPLDSESLDIELVHNDGGNFLDGDVEIYIGITCICWIGWIAIMKDGRVGIGEEDDPSDAMKPIDVLPDAIAYLDGLSFDTSNLRTP